MIANPNSYTTSSFIDFFSWFPFRSPWRFTKQEYRDATWSKNRQAFFMTDFPSPGLYVYNRDGSVTTVDVSLYGDYAVVGDTVYFVNSYEYDPIVIQYKIGGGELTSYNVATLAETSIRTWDTGQSNFLQSVSSLLYDAESDSLYGVIVKRDRSISGNYDSDSAHRMFVYNCGTSTFDHDDLTSAEDFLRVYDLRSGVMGVYRNSSIAYARYTYGLMGTSQSYYYSAGYNITGSPTFWSDTSNEWTSLRNGLVLRGTSLRERHAGGRTWAIGTHDAVRGLPNDGDDQYVLTQDVNRSLDTSTFALHRLDDGGVTEVASHTILGWSTDSNDLLPSRWWPFDGGTFYAQPWYGWPSGLVEVT